MVSIGSSGVTTPARPVKYLNPAASIGHQPVIGRDAEPVELGRQARRRGARIDVPARVDDRRVEQRPVTTTNPTMTQVKTRVGDLRCPTAAGGGRSHTTTAATASSARM